MAWTNINQSIDHGRAPLPHCAQQFEKTDLLACVLYWCCDDVWGFLSKRQHSIWSVYYMAISVPTRHVAAAAARSHLIIWRTTHTNPIHTLFYYMRECVFFFCMVPVGQQFKKHAVWCMGRQRWESSYLLTCVSMNPHTNQQCATVPP